MKKRFTSHDILMRQLIREEINKKLLYEGLSVSFNPSFIYPRIKKMGFEDIRYDNNRKIFSINFVLNNDNSPRYEKLNNFMDNVCGWMHGATMGGGKTIPNKLDFLKTLEGNAFLQYEAKFNIEINKLPKILYHLTVFDNLNKILKIGLIPKSSEYIFNYKDRIYFSENIDSLINLAKQKAKTKNIKEFAVLQIETSSLQIGIRFFHDPNFQDGMYTLENIAPLNILPILKISFDEKGNVITEKL